MTATMTLAMCFDEQIPQGKIDDYFDTSKVYFTMPNIINQQNELRTRTFGFAVSVSSESFINEAYKKTNAELINNISSISDLSKYLIACLSEDNLKKN
jgi:hypothetical protein